MTVFFELKWWGEYGISWIWCVRSAINFINTGNILACVHQSRWSGYRPPPPLPYPHIFPPTRTQNILGWMISKTKKKIWKASAPNSNLNLASHFKSQSVWLKVKYLFIALTFYRIRSSSSSWMRTHTKKIYGGRKQRKQQRFRLLSHTHYVTLKSREHFLRSPPARPPPRADDEHRPRWAAVCFGNENPPKRAFIHSVLLGVIHNITFTTYLQYILRRTEYVYAYAYRTPLLEAEPNRSPRACVSKI